MNTYIDWRIDTFIQEHYLLWPTGSLLNSNKSDVQVHISVTQYQEKMICEVVSIWHAIL